LDGEAPALFWVDCKLLNPSNTGAPVELMEFPGLVKGKTNGRIMFGQCSDSTLQTSKETRQHYGAVHLVPTCFVAKKFHLQKNMFLIPLGKVFL